MENNEKYRLMATYLNSHKKYLIKSLKEGDYETVEREINNFINDMKFILIPKEYYDVPALEVTSKDIF